MIMNDVWEWCSYMTEYVQVTWKHKNNFNAA